MLRKIIFWAHLVCGVLTGLVVIVMSATGVVLTYERQMLAWADRAQYADPAPGQAPLPIGELLEAASRQVPEFEARSLRLANDPRAFATLSAGRSSSLRIDRYGGEVLEPAAAGLRSFFSAMTGWHRWFNASRENRAIPRAVTGISNLAFLFLIFSGLYLWLPPTFKWIRFKTRLLFSGKAASARARDYNWHHVIGFWSAIPLAIVVATAVVFSYGWANDLVYRVFGENPSGGAARQTARVGDPSAARQTARAEYTAASTADAAATAAYATASASAVAANTAAASDGTDAPRNPPLTLDELFDRAAAQLPDWQTITLTLPDRDSATAQFRIDQGNGGQPQKRHDVTFDRFTGQVALWQPFDSQTPGRQARLWIRFLHTGEALGLVGQTVAGLVSLASLIMVWTGLALAWRRLVTPLFRRRRHRSGPQAGIADATHS